MNNSSVLYMAGKILRNQCKKEKKRKYIHNSVREHTQNSFQSVWRQLQEFSYHWGGRIKQISVNSRPAKANGETFSQKKILK